MSAVDEKNELYELVKALPKAELHLHLEGAMSVRTLIELAHKHGVQLPPDIHPAVVFDFKNLDDFIRVASLTFSVMLDEDDFRRTTYEMLRQSASHGARHVEFFFSPSSHPVMSYKSMIDGIIMGMNDARQEFGITSFVIPSHNRMLGAKAGLEFLDVVQSYRVPEVVGIGLEFAEHPYPPDEYRELYQAAARAGLRLTAHAGEDGPSTYVRSCVAVLGCDRIDHGYHIVDDEDLLSRYKHSGIWFTCCPTTTRHTTIWKDPSDRSHAIHAMLDAGLNVMINTDDPGFFQCDLTGEYLSLGLPVEKMVQLAVRSIEASWLDDKTKLALRAAWEEEAQAVVNKYNKLTSVCV